MVVISIESPSCATGTRNFIWVIPGSKDIIEGDLLLKPTGDNYKSETDAGFRLNVNNLTETQYDMESKCSRKR